MSERQTKTIDLPSGLKAEIVAFWTLDDFLKIEAAQKRVLDAATVSTDPAKQDQARIEFAAERSAEAEFMAIRLAVRKLIGEDGVAVDATDDEIRNLHWQDGLALRRAIQHMDDAAKKK